ncbi:MAG: site-2 protease family protein [Candidatus Spechtbacterales bacterium]
MEDLSIISFIAFIGILIFSVIVHEVSHGFAALALGDPTAKLAGRLTLNPASHVDPFGSILLPALLSIPLLFGIPSVIFGYARPVPYNPYNLRYQRWGAALVGGAGPASNFLLALVFGMAIRLGLVAGGVELFFVAIVYLNLVLGIFNLVPIPPLDGSKLLFSLFPQIPYETRAFLEQNGWLFLIAFIFFGVSVIFPIIIGAFIAITGDTQGTLLAELFEALGF